MSGNRLSNVQAEDGAAVRQQVAGSLGSSGVQGLRVSGSQGPLRNKGLERSKGPRRLSLPVSSSFPRHSHYPASPFAVVEITFGKSIGQDAILSPIERRWQHSKLIQCSASTVLSTSGCKGAEKTKTMRGRTSFSCIDFRTRKKSPFNI